MKNVVIFGSTGSVGTQVLDVIRQNLDKFNVFGLVANTSDRKLLEQINEFKPTFACLLDSEKAACFDTPKETILLTQSDSIEFLASHTEADVLVVSMLGAVNSLRCMLSGIGADKFIAIASKEAYVCAGDIITQALLKSNAKVVPIDSEHSAIYQLIQNENTKSIRRIVLTASGGAVYGKTAEELASATVDTVLKHPNWDMGAKITVDCATMINKGLEIIEASHLFNLDPSKIDYVVHRQSIVHGIVEFDCGTTTFNLYFPDMRVPINYALSIATCAHRRAQPDAPLVQGAPPRLGGGCASFPPRLPLSNPSPSYEQFNAMTFEQNRNKILVGVDLCRRAIGLGLCAYLNFANDILVHRFLRKEISFLEIYSGISSVLDHFGESPSKKVKNASDLLEIEKLVADFLQKKS